VVVEVVAVVVAVVAVEVVAAVLVVELVVVVVVEATVVVVVAEVAEVVASVLVVGVRSKGLGTEKGDTGLMGGVGGALLGSTVSGAGVSVRCVGFSALVRGAELSACSNPVQAMEAGTAYVAGAAALSSTRAWASETGDAAEWAGGDGPGVGDTVVAECEPGNLGGDPLACAE
jgi:hypothetical protein